MSLNIETNQHFQKFLDFSDNRDYAGKIRAIEFLSESFSTKVQFLLGTLMREVKFIVVEK